MDFSLLVAIRYLRARRRTFVSVIATIAIVGIALGVWALSAVLAITSGFQTAFRNKVLGVNAHVLVLKYGWDFTEYREVMSTVRATPGVVGAAPFLINPMMITRGDRIAGVLVKGVDPALLGQVLDLPTYLQSGTILGLRPPHSEAPAGPEEGTGSRQDRTLDDYIQRATLSLRTPLPSPSPSLDPTRPALLDPDALDPLAPTTPPSTAGAHPPDHRAHRAPVVSPPDARPSPSPHDVGQHVTAPVDLLPSGSTPDTARPPEVAPGDDPLDAYAREVAHDASASSHNPTALLPGVIVGKTLARTLALHLGDEVRVISPLTGADAALVRQGAAPRARDFRVVGVFDAGFDEYDSRLIYVDIWQAQRFFDQGDAVTGVEVKVRDIDRARPIARRLERMLGGPYHTLDWEALNHNLFTALALQKLALSFVITIIIIIAAFNVIATLVMVVLDKKREIAILKAMGADEGSILKIFLVQGLAVGAAGTGLGLALGAINCALLMRYHFPLDSQVYLIRYVPVEPSLGEFAFTGAVAMLIALAASFVPALWASRLTPVEGLRYE